MPSSKTKKLTMLAMLCALAYVVTVVGRIALMPAAPFLKYDAKDVIITIGGFLFGPLSALAVSLVVSLVEMFTISESGIIGFVMNALASACFACTAAFVYKKKRTLSGAVLGLLSGIVLMTTVMLLWNWLLTPLYMNVEREAVAAMLVPIILPFNLIKGGLNAVLTLLLYKPVVRGLRKAHLIEPEPAAAVTGKKQLGGMLVAAGVLLVTCVLLLLAVRGIL